MARKKEYLFDIVPRWLRHSGLPAHLNHQYGAQAWSIFSCLVSLDCRFNLDYPDWFDQSYEEIADLTGLSRRTVSDYLKRLENNGLVSVIRGVFKGRKSSFKIAVHIDTPKHPNSIKAANGGFLARRGPQPNLRYYQRAKSAYPLEPSENNTKRENPILKGYKVQHERVPLLPNNKNDNKKKKRRSKVSAVKQEQVVSPLSSQRGEETHLPTEMEMRERSLETLGKINRRRRQKRAQEEREERERLMLRFNGPEGERTRLVARQLAEREKKEELESPGESKEDEQDGV